MRTDAMSKTPDRDMYLPPLGGVDQRRLVATERRSYWL